VSADADGEMDGVHGSSGWARKAAWAAGTDAAVVVPRCSARFGTRVVAAVAARGHTRQVTPTSQIEQMVAGAQQELAAAWQHHDPPPR
jgi:hypothetical protein